MAENYKQGQTFDNLIVDSFLAGKDHIKFVCAVLKSLWASFDSSISIEHIENAVLCVPKWVHGKKSSIKPDQNTNSGGLLTNFYLYL